MKPTTSVRAVVSVFGLLLNKCQGIPVSNLVARGPQIDCENLSGPPQHDIRWNFETAGDASCLSYHTDAYMHWDVVIPNDNIFDEGRIRDRGPWACGSSVFDALFGGAVAPGFYSCALDKDGTAHLSFTSALTASESALSEGFHKGTCNAFPEVRCHKTR